MLAPSGRWCYVVGGVVEWNYTGIVAQDDKLFYVCSGVWNVDFSGTVVCDGKEYIVENGYAKAVEEA